MMQIKNNDSAEDMKNIDLSKPHFLSGPIKITDQEGQPAMPGDILVVDICDIGLLDGYEWGFTGIFDKENGGGFLTEHFPKACKAIWDFEGIWATSRHIPGVRFPGLIHPGLIGTAPSHELLNIWNTRERELMESGEESCTLTKHLHARPLACLPEPKNALLGAMDSSHPDFDRIATEAARTIPGRENGGNCDIKNLTKGCRIYFPVFVEGALLSMGDIHFSQGDGEVSFCGAIEISGKIDLKCDIIRGGMKEYMEPVGPSELNVNPIFEVSPIDGSRWFSEWLVFEGLSIDENGKQHFMDASIAYKRAVLNCINYLSKFGYSKEQVYLLLSCCPCEGRIAGIVDVPNAVRIFQCFISTWCCFINLTYFTHTAVCYTGHTNSHIRSGHQTQKRWNPTIWSQNCSERTAPSMHMINYQHFLGQLLEPSKAHNCGVLFHSNSIFFRKSL